MNRRIYFVLLLLLLGLAPKLSAQGTAFSYQGRLDDVGAPANASYDFRFAAYDAGTNGNRLSALLTNAAVAVSNGLFTVTLDFGAGVFASGNVWLDLAVRAAGATNFTVLTPRQPVLPVPYAIFATGASNLLGSLATTQLSGTLPSARLAGTYSGTLNFSNAANTFAGTFSGNGSALNNLNASQLTSGTVADARLSANVALLDHNQSFSGSNYFGGPVTTAGTNNFNGVNNFTNRANNFTGSFFGNGLVGWLVVNSAPTNATANTGYLLFNTGLATVNLPPSSALLVGDIVRVAGAGPGGWQARANSGQSIFGNFSNYKNGYQISLPLTGLPAAIDYLGVAASSDGVRLYAVGNFTGVYGSANSGQSWGQLGSLTGSWNTIACSANGQIVYAAPTSGSAIQFSTNAGANWASTGVNGSTVACTADGGKIFTGKIACSGDGTNLAKISSGITISTNSGSTWSSISAPSGNLGCLAVSSDCTRIVAGVSNGLLYASANLGATWTTLTTSNQFWSGAWMSADGSRYAATTSKNGINGGIFYSSVSPQPNTIATNSIVGSRSAAVELQYLGNNQFMPVSSAGSLWAN